MRYTQTMISQKQAKNDAKPTLMRCSHLKDNGMKPKTNLGDETNVRA